MNCASTRYHERLKCATYAHEKQPERNFLRAKKLYVHPSYERPKHATYADESLVYSGDGLDVVFPPHWRRWRRGEQVHVVHVRHLQILHMAASPLGFVIGSIAWPLDALWLQGRHKREFESVGREVSWNGGGASPVVD